jgi:hypothetical protein
LSSNRGILDELGAVLSPYGLDLIGAASVERYDASVPAAHALRRMAPDAVTAIVIGNGGGAFWEAYRRFCQAHAEHERLADPLDAFTRIVIDDAAAQIGMKSPARVVYPFEFSKAPVSFMQLAECAGLGRRSLVGVLVHPVYGPWMALRAAILVPFLVTAPRPAEGFDPCPTCIERACMPACPAQAVGDAGWDIPRCAAHRQRDDGCESRCHARFDCVIGRAHRYPSEALAFHQQRSRAALLGHAAGRWPA